MHFKLHVHIYDTVQTLAVLVRAAVNEKAGNIQQTDNVKYRI